MMKKNKCSALQEDNDNTSDLSSKADGSVSLAEEQYRLMSDISCKYGVAYQGKTAKKRRINKWSQKEYIIQDKEHVDHHNFKMTCGFWIFPELEYKPSQKNQRVACGLGRNYHFIMDPMPSKGKCEISRYHAHACLPCTISLNKQLVHCNADE